MHILRGGNCVVFFHFLVQINHYQNAFDSNGKKRLKEGTDHIPGSSPDSSEDAREFPHIRGCASGDKVCQDEAE